MIKLDWPAYWREFKRVHGDPVVHGGRCIFADGWAYSMTSYAGPEWMPPEDPRELLAIKRAYWTVRLRVVQEEHARLEADLRALEDMQRCRSVPLQVTAREADEDGGKSWAVTKDLDVKRTREGRLAWLSEDVKECRKKLAELDANLQGRAG